MPPERAKRPAAAAATATNSGRVAVVDIGSNSIRLVVFTRAARAPFTLFNEKVLCGLGRGLDASGKLNESGAKLALENLARFVKLAEAMDVTRLDLIATAAVRDAGNGAEFVREIEKRCGAKARILSGEEEARMSAMGVISGIPEADGFMGDLGGASVELVALDHGAVGAHATLPLGPLRLKESAVDDLDAARDVIDKHLETIDWLAKVRGRAFYPVGGAWRTLARIHMEQSNYPLHVIHHYSVSRRQAEDLARIVARLGRRSLASMPNLSKRRVETLPFAALLLERLLRLAKPERVIFSAFGLREGYLYAGLSRAERARDPLVAACAEFAEVEGRFGDQGQLLQAWTDPVFRKDSERERRLRLAACTLGDVGWREHPDYRAEQVFTRVLRLPIAGVDHAGRVAVALALYARYAGDMSTEFSQHVLGMLTEEEREHWISLGLALRLAYSLSAGTAEVLRRAQLSMTDARLTLSLPRGSQVLYGEAVERRLEALGRVLGRNVTVA